MAEAVRGGGLRLSWCVGGGGGGGWGRSFELLGIKGVTGVTVTNLV